MKVLLVVLLVFMLMVDTYLAITLFKPDFIFSVKRGLIGNVELYSTIPNKKISISNRSLLNKRLAELGFWNERAIQIRNSWGNEYVTAKFLIIELTDKPQEIVSIKDEGSGNTVHFSYGRSYDPKTQTVKIVVHLNPSYFSSFPPDQRYSGVVLYPLIDLTVKDLPDGKTDLKRVLSLVNGFFLKNPEKNVFLKID